MTEPALTVSVVINTYNRAQSLKVTLDSLPRQNYPHFEVIVVNGPSTDDTMELLKSLSPSIRVGTCADRNLSVSRNVGIQMARGELVAFLDDDAVPDENWLRDVVAAFDSPEVGGAGGVVYDHTGYNLQYRYSLSNRLGTARWNVPRSGEEFCYPGCLEFPYVQGTNAVFRRDALLEIGGFDEEFNYYLDETDVCLRLVDAGFLLRQLDNAFVYHRFLPSHIRSAERVVTSWYAVVKNKVYFSLKSAPPGTQFLDLLRDWKEFCQESEKNLRFHIDAGRAPKEKLEDLHREIDEALWEGVRVGLHRPRRLLGSSIAAELRGPVEFDVFDPLNAGKFKLCPVLLPKSEKLTICLLSEEYPPAVTGGIGRLTRDLAGGLASRGHNVHVLTQGKNLNTVDFEEGVWVHRLIKDREEPACPPEIAVPSHIWQNSARLLRELHRIDAMHPIDIVEGPIWNTEGIAAAIEGKFRVVTNLETPLKVWRKTNSSLWQGTPAELEFFERQVAAEKMLMELSTASHAISEAIVETMHHEYGMEFAPGQMTVVPLGMEDRSLGVQPGDKKDFVDVLFTGRFETRKGIDILLQAIPTICSKYPKVRFLLVGNDPPQADGGTFAASFRAQHKRSSFRDRVLFLGKIPDRELESYLAQCDIFVGPSRYESFGLVFLEAMMFGKPMIGCRAGGMKEVIADNVIGLLAEPGNVESLQAALDTLLSDPAKRATMGEAARKRFLDHYTREESAERTLTFYRGVLQSPAVRAPQLNEPVNPVSVEPCLDKTAVAF
jgi:glycosyltransferase involved in cell wall biosynthesis/GT2 family glycosyltransferase